jgi:flagellar biosynthesis/type III secretory pathway protein FliH
MMINKPKRKDVKMPEQESVNASERPHEEDHKCYKKGYEEGYKDGYEKGHEEGLIDAYYEPL